MLSFFARQFRSLAPMFRPPFDGLWLAVLLYYFWSYLVFPHSGILRGNLPDPDDYMYLDQVLDWIKGQGWFDNVQHRLDPPIGGQIHFSRLTEIPMALLTLLFEGLGLSPTGAAMIMAMIEPLILFAGFFAAIRWAAASFMPKEWAGITAFVTLFASGLTPMFAPGHVDHHGLILVLIATALGFCARMMREPDRLRWAIGAGAILAVALTVALEILPWLIVISAGLGLWAVVKGRAAAHSGLVYGLVLYIASAALLLITEPPAQLFVPNMMAYSVVYVLFTGSIAVVFAGISLAAKGDAVWRFLLAAALAAATGIMFLTHFPALAGGPWNAVDPDLSKMILNNVNEAYPLAKLEHNSVFFIVLCVLSSFIGLGAGVYFFRNATSEQRWPWGLLLALFVAALGLTIFYQIRYVGALEMFSVIPLAALLAHGWKRVGAHWRGGRRRVLAEIGLLLLIGPLPGVLFPAAVDGRSFNTGVLLFPAFRSHEDMPCDTYHLERVLKAPELDIGKPHIIMNTMGLGPELLFRTKDYVLSAPYHEDVAGNLDAARFFAATNPKEAEAIIRRRHADLVVVCREVPDMYLRDAVAKMMAANASGKPYVKEKAPVIIELARRHAPSWLKPVESPELTNYVVYRVVPLPTAGGKSRARE